MMLAWLKGKLPKNWSAFVAWGVMCLTITFLGVFLGCPNPPLPNPPIPIWLQAGGPDGHNFGWNNDPSEVKAIADTLRWRVFGDTPAGKIQDALPDHVYLWEIYKKADPRGPPVKNQGSLGSCVPFGTNQAILRTMGVAIALGKAEELHDIAEEVTYGGSRVQVGHGQLGIDQGGAKDRHQGSTGAWAAQWAKQWGVVARQPYPSVDLSTYSVQLCRSWGNSGVPADIQALAKEHPVGSITQITSWADAKKALASGYGIAVCSDQGFTMQRDANGICAPRGHWGHCMCIDGYATINGAEYGHIQNSWGEYLSGPSGPGNPDNGGFWAASGTVTSMIGAGDTWTFSSVQGFPAQPKVIDWFVRRNAAHEPALASLWRMDHAHRN